MMSSIDNTIKINLEDEDKGLWNISVDEQLKYFLKIKPDGMRQDDFNIVLGLLCCQPNKTLFDFSGFNLKNDEKNLLGKLQRQDYTLKYPELNTGDKDAIALMYSGGVDSIAASLLYEKPIKIFAGYGGWFERESDIIDLLGSDFIVTTNFRLNSVAMDKSIPSEKNYNIAQKSMDIYIV